MNKNTANAFGITVGCLFFCAMISPLLFWELLFWLFVISIALVAIVVIIKIWRIEHQSDGAKIIRLVQKANKGDIGAREGCDKNPFVNKRLVYQNGELHTHYEASREVYGMLWR